MTEDLALLKLEPMAFAKPWGGGRRLRSLGLDVPIAPPTGEVWLVSDIEGKASRVAEGPFRGASLRTLLTERRAEILGSRAGAPRFPLLVKWLEVEGALSVQVHPDASAARRLGDGTTGKHETWWVADASESAEVVLGLTSPLALDDVRRLAEEGALAKSLKTHRLKPGQTIDISPGTIHAARGGVLLLEVQETADVTYRLHDWGAVGLDGRPRELQLEKAIACARLGGEQPVPGKPPSEPLVEGVSRAVATSARAPFSFEIVELSRGASYEPVRSERDGSPGVIVALRGRVAVSASSREYLLAAGEGAIVSACAESVSFKATDKASLAWACARGPSSGP